MSFSFQLSAEQLLAAQVVAQHGQPVVRLSPLEADAAHERAREDRLNEAEDVLHTAADFGFFAVVCLLLGCQRMVDPALFAETGSDVEAADGFFELLAGIGGVSD